MPPPGGSLPTQGMYMPPNSQQPFTQTGPPNMGYAPPQASMAGGGASMPGGTGPGGYQSHLPSQTQTDGGQMSGPHQGNFPPAGVGYPDQGPASMPPQMPPGQGQAPSGGQGYNSLQPNMEYNSFNMQSELTSIKDILIFHVAPLNLVTAIFNFKIYEKSNLLKIKFLKRKIVSL